MCDFEFEFETYADYSNIFLSIFQKYFIPLIFIILLLKSLKTLDLMNLSKLTKNLISNYYQEKK